MRGFERCRIEVLKELASMVLEKIKAFGRSRFVKESDGLEIVESLKRSKRFKKELGTLERVRYGGFGRCQNR